MPTFNDPPSRIESLIATAEPKLRRAFLLAVSEIKDNITLSRISRLLEQGRVQEAFLIASAEWERFASEWIKVYVNAGSEAAEFIDSKLVATVSFDQVNAGAVVEMQQNQLRLVQGLTQEQVRATSQALTEAIEAGVNPRQQARAIRDSIGLTSKQEDAVRNFRRLLEENSRESLTRKLRDRRFDRSIERALDEGVPLDKKSIDRMVTRYRERFLSFRATVVARTESLRSVNEGNDRMYTQAVEDGTLSARQLTRIWNTSRDERVRGSHVSMHKQRRPVGQDFVSGNGVLLRLPGDSSAPASETVQCRCIVSHRFTAVVRSEDRALSA